MQTPPPRPFPRVLVLLVLSGNLIFLSIPSSSLPRLRHKLPKHLPLSSDLPQSSQPPPWILTQMPVLRADSTLGSSGSLPKTLSPLLGHWFHYWAAQAPPQDFGSTPRCSGPAPGPWLRPYVVQDPPPEHSPPFLPGAAAGAYAGQNGSAQAWRSLSRPGTDLGVENGRVRVRSVVMGTESGGPRVPAGCRRTRQPYARSR